MFVRKMWGAPTVYYKNEGSTQTVTQQTQLPGWIQDAAQKNLNQAYNVSQAMPGPYGGPRYAGMTDGLAADIAGLQLQVGQTQPGYGLAQSGAAGLMNYRPGMVQSGEYEAAQIGATPQMTGSFLGGSPQMNGSYIDQAPQMGASYISGVPQIGAQNIDSLPMMNASLIRDMPQMQGAQMLGRPDQVQADQISPAYLADANLQKYMNPYTQNVIDNAMKSFDAQRLQSLNNIGDQAARSNAFGGSRQGILEGVTNAASALNAGNLASNLMAQNFAQAQQAAMGDITRNLAAQQANQSANLQAGTQNVQSALQAALANQSVQQNTGQANLNAAMQSALANQNAAQNAGQTNLQAGLQAAMANQASGLNAQQANQNSLLKAALSNQSADMSANSANQQAEMQRALANQQAGMTTQGTNLQAAMQAALADQQAGMTTQGTNLQALMQSALANQQAGNQAAQFNVGNNLQAQLANQQAGLQGAGFNLSAANALGQLTGQGQAAYLDSLRSAMAGQQIAQQDKQAQYDALRQAYTENQQFPLQQLQIPLQALGMTPYPTSTTTTGPAQSSGSGLLQGIGAGASAIGALGSLASLLPLSDETEKTDIKKVGKDDETGLNLYAYRYKGDPKTYPKVVGPMAQDIAKKYPDEVHEVGGKMAVNLGFGPMRRAFN